MQHMEESNAHSFLSDFCEDHYSPFNKAKNIIMRINTNLQTVDIPCESNFSYKAHAKSVDPSPAIAQEEASIINIEQHKL